MKLLSALFAEGFPGVVRSGKCHVSAVFINDTSKHKTNNPKTTVSCK